MLRTSIVVLIALALTSAIVSAAIPSDYLTTGRAQLFNGTLSGVRAAYQTFDTGIKNTAGCPTCATDRELRFFRAAAGTAMLFIRDDAGSINSFLELLKAFDMTCTGQYWAPYYEFGTNVVDFSLPENDRGVYEIPADAPTQAQIQSIFDVSMIPQIDAILGDLNFITDSPDVFKIYLTPTETRIFFRTNSDVFGAIAPDPDARFLAPLEVDRGEVYLLKAFLLFLKSQLQNQQAYDTYTAPNDPILAKIYGEWLGIKKDFIDAYPTFLKVAPTANNPANGKTILAQAKQNLISSLTLYQQTISYIRAENSGGTDPQDDELFYFDADNDRLANNLRARITTLKNSLVNDTVATFPVIITDTYVLTSSNGGWRLTLNYDILDRLDDAYVDCGLFFSYNSGAPRNWKIDYAEQDGDQLYAELTCADPDTAAAGYLTATLSGTTISGGTFTYWGDAGGTINSIAGSLNSTNTQQEDIDLNPVYGSSTRYPNPVSPRDILPQFDSFNSALPGTVGSGLSNDATLGGILPGWTQYTWQTEMYLQPSGNINVKSNTNLNYSINGDITGWNAAYRLFTDPADDTEFDEAEITGVDMAQFYMAYDPAYLYGAITFHDTIDAASNDYYYTISLSYTDDDSSLDAIAMDIELYDGMVQYMDIYQMEDMGGYTDWNWLASVDECAMGTNTIEFRVPIGDLPALDGRYVIAETWGGSYPDYFYEDEEYNWTHIKIGQTGTLGGTVAFNGPADQPVFVQAYTDPYDPEESTVARTMRIGPGAYTLQGIGLNWSGYVRAYTSLFGFDNVFELGAFEVASNALAVTQSSTSVTGKNLNVTMPPVLQNNVARTGTINIELNPEDQFAFDAIEGGIYTFKLTGAIGDSAWITILDRSAGEDLDADYDWDVSSITAEWMCETSGRYYFEVEDFGSGGGYSLKMTVHFPVIGSRVPDFNGDGRNDVLWCRESTSAYKASLINADLTKALERSLGGTSDLRIVGLADFNNDGRTDLLWRRKSTGEHRATLMNADLTKALDVSLGGDLDFQVIGLADFNNDGRTDLLWHRVSTGAMNGVLMGANLVQGTSQAIGGDLNVRIVGLTDFSNDGCTDLLWRTLSTGAYKATLMNANLTKGTEQSLGGSLNSPIVGLADFNDDGRSDLVWRLSNGSFKGTLMNANLIKGTERSLGGTADLKIVGLTDFNADGRSDLLWRRLSTGASKGTLMNANLTKSTERTFSGGTLDMQIIALPDFNGSGGSDLLWQRLSTGSTKAVLINADLTQGAYRGLGGDWDLEVVVLEDLMVD